MSGCVVKTICILYYVCELKFKVEEVMEIMGERQARQALRELIALRLVKKRGRRYVWAADPCTVYRAYLECIRAARKTIGSSRGEELTAIMRCLNSAVARYVLNNTLTRL